ncbi:MAG: hypothetical protein ABI605_15460 [Rhizobacter sp.]
MKRTVFYSWQSDLPSAGNRNLIEDALKRAIRAIARDADSAIEPVLDRDTANLAGTPDIAQSILTKISTADVFVADVSIVSAGAARPSPNPNVLVELGYAVAELGWDNIVLVQNTASGGPELLPFDLRGRRVVTYALTEGSERAEARGLLQGRLENALRGALEVGMTGNLPSGRDAKLWWGTWHVSSGDIFSATLFVREVGPSGFLFDLEVHHGAHQGQITEYARIVSQDLAYCRVSNGDGHPDGELVFRRRTSDGSRVIDIEEATPCTYHRGMRAHFGGTLVREREPWFDAGHLNELEMARLYGLLGEHLDKMRSSTGDVGERDNLDDDLDARVYWGGIAGLYTFMESVVMVTQSGKMWAAYLDDNVIRYFTNVPEYRQTLPKTIQAWRSRFADKQIAYCDPTVVVPSRQV